MKSVVAVADRVTVATAAGVGAATVAVAAPVRPSLVATIDAEPAETAVTTPVELTVATSGFALDHVTDRPVSTLPAASRSVAVAWDDCPTDIELLCGLLSITPGRMVAIPDLRFRLLRLGGFSPAENSAVPHNALHDARALRDHVVNQLEI